MSKDSIDTFKDYLFVSKEAIADTYNIYIKPYVIEGYENIFDTNEVDDTQNKKDNKTVENKQKDTNVSKICKKKYRKKKIPKALREQVWIAKMGRKFSGACLISWCTNEMNCFSFDCGHNIPESKGGPTNVENLIPICRNCNLGMGNRLTIEQWQKKYETPKKWYQFW